MHRAILPAARANCVVVSDSCQADPGKAPNIYDQDPEKMLFSDVDITDLTLGGAASEMFGYGDSVFWSIGNNLKM